jgi:hypothetical protein
MVGLHHELDIFVLQVAQHCRQSCGSKLRDEIHIRLWRACESNVNTTESRDHRSARAGQDQGKKLLAGACVDAKTGEVL